MTRIRSFALAVCLVAPLPALAQTPQSTTPVVSTRGEGLVRRPADRALITIAAETRDARAAEARGRNAQVMTDLQRALRDAGIPEDAIRTTGFNVMPDMEYSDGRSTLKGYIVRNEIEVRIDDIDNVSRVIDAANVPRGVALHVGPPRFELKERDAAESEALRLAVRDALDRAGAIAEGAGRRLGDIVRIDDQQAGPPAGPPMPLYRMAAAESAPDTPIVPGTIEVRAAVIVTVELE